MSTHASNLATLSTGAAGERGRAPVLRAVPMATTRVLFTTQGEGRGAVKRWLAANRSARESDLGVPFKMKRSYASMGSIRDSLDIGSTKPQLQVGGANILGSPADTYNLLSTGSFHPIPASPVFSNLESDASDSSSPSTPSEMPQTPVVNTSLSDGESRVDNVMRRLDYHDAHKEDATEALRLERLLEMQMRDSSAQRVSWSQCA
ncbi:hypothetical protein FRC10_005005 [Ceratobasidium sp. 414]|nr:hypothetical protein FRC10_005005 [Ceratobasidium sp. 414]